MVKNIRWFVSWWSNWQSRHQHPASVGLHIVGIPLTIAAVALGVVQFIDWRWDLWWRPVGLLAGGYFLQWLGHRIEGNTMGELILILKWLGRPYAAISPKYQERDSDLKER